MMVDYAPVYDDLELEKYRCRYVYPDLQVAMPFTDGKCLYLYSDVPRSCATSKSKISFHPPQTLDDEIDQ